MIVAGERNACKSHGLYRIEGTLRTVKAAKVCADAVPRLLEGHGGAIVRVDADGGFANPAFAAGRPGDPFACAETLFEALMGQGARLPSQRRFQARDRASNQGIALSADDVALLNWLLERGLDAVY